MTHRVVVVGAGVAGLATAYRLRSAHPSLEVEVLESTEFPGGRLATATVGDLQIDSGPDSFVARKPWAAELARELGLDLEVPGAKGAAVWTEGGLVGLPPSALGVPAEMDGLVRWPGLSRRGRARALSDLVRKPRSPEHDESLGALLRRRLGDEATEVLVAPLLAGWFAGDIDGLSVRATFPELGAWEREWGSLIRGAKAASRAGRDAGPMFMRPAAGVRALSEALVRAIGPGRLRTQTPVREVTAAERTGPRVRTAGGTERTASAVVLATPSFVTGELLRSVAPVAAGHLDAIANASTGVVLLVYPEGSADALPDTTGFVVPRGRAPMTAATFLSRCWPRAAFGDRAVVRCSVGGIGSEDVLEAEDEQIVEAVCRHLAAVLPLPERPQASSVVRWPRSMPQYGVGHLDRVAAILDGLPAGIFVAGNAYRGVGIADAVGSANEAAERVWAHIAGGRIRTERVR